MDVDDDCRISFEDANNSIPLEVDVMDLLNFGGPNLMRNGDTVYKSKHLLELGIISYGENTCKIDGACIQSSHPADPPHTITIQTALAFTDWTFYCSCKAGNGGRCKHLYAAILHIHIKKKLALITCTSRKRNWGKISKEVAATILEPELISNLAEMKRNRPEYHVAPEEYQTFQQILFSDKKSAVAKFLQRHENAETAKASQDESENATPPASCKKVFTEGDDGVQQFLNSLFKENDFRLRTFVDRTPEVILNFYNKRICLSLEEAVDLCIETRDQKSSLWLFERKLRLTASECYKLFTASKNTNTVWRSKIANYFKEKPNLKCFEIGRREEVNGLKLYENKTKSKVTKFGLVVHPTCPWLGCSADGFILQSKTVIEVKTLLNKENQQFNVALSKVQYLFRNNNHWHLRTKHIYYGQIQVNMHLLFAKKADLVIHNFQSKEIQIIHVNYDKEFCTQLIASLKSVYFNHALPYIYENFVTETDKNKYKNK